MSVPMQKQIMMKRDIERIDAQNKILSHYELCARNIRMEIDTVVKFAKFGFIILEELAELDENTGKVWCREMHTDPNDSWKVVCKDGVSRVLKEYNFGDYPVMEVVKSNTGWAYEFVMTRVHPVLKSDDMKNKIVPFQLMVPVFAPDFSSCRMIMRYVEI